MNAPAAPQPTPPSPWGERWHRFSAAAVRGFHSYANWLVGITWLRFVMLSLLLLVIVGILHDQPPLTWTVTERVEERPARAAPKPPRPPKPPVLPAPARSPQPSTPGGGTAPGTPAPPEAASSAQPAGRDSPIRIVTPRRGEGIDISIGRDGIRITPRPASPASAADPEARAAAGAGSAGRSGDPLEGGVHISLPPGANTEAVRDAVEVARREIEDALREAREEAEAAEREAAEARHDAEVALAELAQDQPRTRTIRTRVGIGDFLMQLTVLFVLGSALVKATYKGRVQAERQAARATETAEAESLKRQVMEARMAAMQAQVEPHFLFNTLASIDHLIETDPARASQMQKNLIALLRASMPTMRETAGGGGNGVRELGRELAVIRPYLEILKVRMEERLATEVDVPDGLLSAEFPPMVIQTLVENAIKHGLEPKAEGGTLSVKAQVVHGKLQVTVADTGLGFGKAPTAGTGVGLANIRERLSLLYGSKASLVVAENAPIGTVVTVTVPYKTIEGAGTSAA